MQYLKRNTKISILAFLIIVLSITISISTFTKTEVYFSVYDNPQKEIIKNINQFQAFISASPEELTSILQISEPLAQKIIALREELKGFKEPPDLTQLTEITNLE